MLEKLQNSKCELILSPNNWISNLWTFLRGALAQVQYRQLLGWNLGKFGVFKGLYLPKKNILSLTMNLVFTRIGYITYVPLQISCRVPLSSIWVSCLGIKTKNTKHSILSHRMVHKMKSNISQATTKTIKTITFTSLKLTFCFLQLSNAYECKIYLHHIHHPRMMNLQLLCASSMIILYWSVAVQVC